MHIECVKRLVGLFGNPVAHSFSPAMHNAAYEAMGLPWVYLPFSIKAEDLAKAVESIRVFNMVGANITIPFKEQIIPFLDSLDSHAVACQAVNTVLNKDGKLIGYNTDGQGFFSSLTEHYGLCCMGKTMIIFGTGGAGKAVAVEFALGGGKELFLVNRTFAKAAELETHVQTLETSCITHVLPWDEKELLPALKRADIVVNATPCGMWPKVHEMPSIPIEHLPEWSVVCDLVYNPPLTGLLKKANSLKLRTLSGLGMLVFQGALAIEIWSGMRAPVEVMEKTFTKISKISFPSAGKL